MDGDPREGTDWMVQEAVAAAEHVSTEPDGWLPAARKVVETGSFVVLDGMVLDQFSASTMTQIYDALGPEAQAQFAAMHPIRAHTIAFKLAAKFR